MYCHYNKLIRSIYHFGFPSHFLRVPFRSNTCQPPNTDIAVLDKTCIITDQEAISLCHNLAKESGILIGGSGGLAVFAGLAWLYQNSGNTALSIIPDSGINYLDQFYNEDWLYKNNVNILNQQALKTRIKSKQIKNTIA